MDLCKKYKPLTLSDFWVIAKYSLGYSFYVLFAVLNFLLSVWKLEFLGIYNKNKHINWLRKRIPKLLPKCHVIIKPVGQIKAVVSNLIILCFFIIQVIS